MKIFGAAISLQGKNFAVVSANRELIDSPGEADMAIETLQPVFAGVQVVLMSQSDDGTPTYYGDRDLVAALEGVPVDEMPWKEYSTG